MHRPPATRPGPAILAIALIAAACSASGASGSGAAALPTAAPPVATTTASPASPTAAATATRTATIPTPTAAAEPPAAALSVEGGDPVAGALGSYTWNGGGSDSPWLPGAPITIGAGERLSASLEPGVGIATWSVDRVPAGTPDRAGAVGLGDGNGPIAFASPAKGHWSVQLLVRFADDLGSAAYYWDVTVR